LLEIDLLEGKTLEMFTVVAVGWLLKKMNDVKQLTA